uniref:Tetratricopeptide repeat protein 39A n=1 Tax=Aceria tosichella TaxID=561515 RepID=A0A6G1SNJ8_9ACAR
MTNAPTTSLDVGPGKLEITKTACENPTLDTDSGHERTSSSSASNCSEEQFYQDQDQTDCFEDASDVLEAANQKLECQLAGRRSPEKHTNGDVCHMEAERAELKFRLEETREILRLALSNQFVKAIDLCADRAKNELYAGLAHATLSFLRAALTIEQADLKAAIDSINQSFEVSQSKRRPVSTASMVMRLLYKPNYNSYTDDEIHAELVNAESMLLLSLISFLADQSVLCLVRGAFRIRACYQRYKECHYILENRTEWASDEARRHFESGVRMGLGIFNLLMSYLPRRVLKFLEYVGFSGSRSVGVSELDRSISLDDGLRSVFSALVILTYHSYVENLFGLGHYDRSKVEHLNETFLGHYPDSAFFLLFLGRYHQMQGNLMEAISSFERCCQVQQDWKQFHSICHWEIMWCYASQMDWPKAAHYANMLRQHSKWSPSSYQYQYGTFLYAQLIEDERAGLIERESSEFLRRQEEIVEIIQKVPSLRIRYAGKTIPADKFAITRSEKFCRQNGRLSLPALEFLYIWNIFCTLKNSPKQVGALLERIDSEIEFIQKQQAAGTRDGDLADSEPSASSNGCQAETVPETATPVASSTSESQGDRNIIMDSVEAECWTDDLCLMHLLRGMCLKQLDRYQEAEEAFMEIMIREQDICIDKFLAPHAAMELATLNLHLKQYECSRQWIKTARHNYTGYLMETIVHFRLHAASRVIRNEQQLNELENSQNSCVSNDANP